uniref:Uncharacterized protein n=1 Tax=Anguilla anguilla TaxID=7936 RepID=A0A0E9RMM2_ANGAN
MFSRVVEKLSIKVSLAISWDYMFPLQNYCSFISYLYICVCTVSCSG